MAKLINLWENRPKELTPEWIAEYDKAIKELYTVRTSKADPRRSDPQ